jgi:hypothetical protein
VIPITIVQIVAILLGLVNLALYLFNWQDTAEQIKHLIWIFLCVVVYLHDDQSMRIADMLDGEEEEDASD